MALGSYKTKILSHPALDKTNLKKKHKHDEKCLLLCIGLVLYSTVMFGLFVFVEFELMNRFCRYYLEVVPYIGVKFFPCNVINGVGAATASWFVSFYAATAFLFYVCTNNWISVVTPQGQSGLLRYKKGPNGKAKSIISKAGLVLGIKDCLKIFKAHQVLVKIGLDVLKRPLITFHHNAANVVISILTFSGLRYMEYHTVASIIGLPAMVGMLNFLEYSEVHLVSSAADVTREFLKEVRRHTGTSKMWKKELRFLKPIVLELYYPIRSTNRQCYSHFVQLYSLNTTDLLLAFN